MDSGEGGTRFGLSVLGFYLRNVGVDDTSIKITHCGVCYADVIWTRNTFGDANYPLVHGHAINIAGVVKEVGANVDRSKAGDHIGIGTYVNSCRECEYCNEGIENYCSKGSVHTFNSVHSDGTITEGGFSSFIVPHQR